MWWNEQCRRSANMYAVPVPYVWFSRNNYICMIADSSWADDVFFSFAAGFFLFFIFSCCNECIGINEAYFIGQQTLESINQPSRSHSYNMIVVKSRFFESVFGLCVHSGEVSVRSQHARTSAIIYAGVVMMAPWQRTRWEKKERWFNWRSKANEIIIKNQQQPSRHTFKLTEKN